MSRHAGGDDEFREEAAEEWASLAALEEDGLRQDPACRERPLCRAFSSDVGPVAAAFLRQIGWDADVYERSAVELVGRGAGITTHPELLQALQCSGANTHNLGVKVERRIALDHTGYVIAEKRLPQILTFWDRLQRLLRESMIIRCRRL